jgi:hypothetical protein
MIINIRNLTGLVNIMFDFPDFSFNQNHSFEQKYTFSNINYFYKKTGRPKGLAGSDEYIRWVLKNPSGAGGLPGNDYFPDNHHSVQVCPQKIDTRGKIAYIQLFLAPAGIHLTQVAFHYRVVRVGFG